MRLGWTIKKRQHQYYGPETQVTIELPFFRRRRFWVPAYDNFVTGRPVLFLAFGRVSCSKHGWHMRGDIQPTDIIEGTVKRELGYQRPINLANY